MFVQNTEQRRDQVSQTSDIPATARDGRLGAGDVRGAVSCQYGAAQIGRGGDEHCARGRGRESAAKVATDAAAPSIKDMLSADVLEAIYGDKLSILLERGKVVDLAVDDVIVMGALLKSKRESRRSIKNGSAYLSNQ